MAQTGLYIWARTHRIAEILSKYYGTLGEEIRSNTVVLVVVASTKMSQQIFSCSKPIDNRKVLSELQDHTSRKRSKSCSCDDELGASELRSRPPRVKRLISSYDNDIVFCEQHTSTPQMVE